MCSPRCRDERNDGSSGLPCLRSQAAFVLTMRNGGVASVTLDYLRPAAAPTHADERLRIAGTRGVIETALIEEKVTLITETNPPRTLPLSPQTHIFTQFAITAGRGITPFSLHEACRITEIAIKAQQAADTKAVVTLGDCPLSHTFVTVSEMDTGKDQDDRGIDRIRTWRGDPGQILPQSEWAKTAVKRLPDAGPLDWPAIFGRTAPVVLDLGCGNGRFTLMRL